MKRIARPHSCLLLMACLATVSFGQDIRVKKQPVPDHLKDQEIVYDKWWVSGALRDDKEASILGTAYKSLAEAQAYAKRWLASNHKVNKPSDWTYLKFVEIEGDYSVKEKKGKETTEFKESIKEKTGEETIESKESMGKGSFADPNIKFGSPEDKLFTAAIDRAGATLKQDIKDALRKRNRTVQDEFRRAKQALEFMQKDVTKLEAAQFRKVNGLVKQYNGTLMNYSSSGPGSELFSRLSPMQPFSDEMIRQAIAADQARQMDAKKAESTNKLTEPTAWLRFSARGDSSQVGNVSVHFNLYVLYPDNTFIHYQSVSSYLGTLGDEAKNPAYYYGPDRLSAQPYVGGTWKQAADGAIEFEVLTVNKSEKQRTTGFFAYKPSNFTHMGRYYLENDRLAIQKGKTSEYDSVKVEFHKSKLGNTSKEAQRASDLVGL